MSTLESISPSSSRSTASPSDSAGASPRSEETSNLDDDTGQKKEKRKLVRTCYTNEQIQKLMRIFHENPYPDSEQMEDIAREFGVADNKIKVHVYVFTKHLKQKNILSEKYLPCKSVILLQMF